MSEYIDGFVLPIPRVHLNEYKNVAEQVGEIWKEYGAIAYYECVGDDLSLEGVRSFIETIDVNDDELVIFGWVIFPSKEIRDIANQKVPLDPRMSELVAPLLNPDRLIFDSSRMTYGGFKAMVQL